MGPANYVVLLAVMTSHVQADDFKCLTTPAVTPGLKMPPLPQQFSIDIEANFLDLNSSMEIKEFYDYPGNRGVLEVTQQGMTAKIIYNYNTNEMFTFIDIPGDDGTTVQQSCDIQMLNQTSDSDLIRVFSYTAGNNTNHIYSVKHVYDFGGPTENYAYLGTSTVRGILVDHWYTCSKWTDGKSMVDVHWYYSAAGTGWYSASLGSVPVRAHMRGHMINERGESRDIEHIYDFFRFKPKLPEGHKMENVFQVPPRTYCQGQVKTKPFPNLEYFPLYFSASVEIINPVSHIISHANIKYDQVYSLARYETTFADLDTNPDAASKYGAMVMIHDFNTGVQYQIDSSTFECKIAPINPVLGDSKPAPDTVQQIQISSVVELLKLNQTTYTYVGTRDCRMAKCDVFVMIRDDWPFDNKDKTETVWEWYFLTSDYVQLQSTIPFQVVITQLNRFAGPMDPKFNRVINFVDWDSEDEPNIFYDFSDIQHCYTTSDQLRHLQFLLPAMDNNGVPITVDIKTLRFAILNTIISSVAISPIRIYDLQVEYKLNTEDIYVTFTLLDAAPTISPETNTLPEPSVQEAAKTVNETINSGKFTIAIASNPEEPQLITAKPISLVEVVRVKVPCPNKTEIIIPVVSTTIGPQTTDGTNGGSRIPGQQTTKTAIGNSTGVPRACDRLPQTAEHQLSTGAIAGIAVGSGVFGVLITLLVGFLVRWRLRNYGDSHTFPMMRFK